MHPHCAQSTVRGSRATIKAHKFRKISPMTFPQNLPRGRAFVRSLICRSLGHVGNDARGFALDRWGSAQAEIVTKSTVTALLAQHDPEAQEFFAPVLERSLLGRLSGLRRVPFNVRMLSMVGGAGSHWISPAAPRPISKPALDGAWLQPASVGAIAVTTSESVAEGGPVAEEAPAGEEKAEG